MSQTDLADRAGVVQSVISAYESGHRQPALPTLQRLVDATGFELTVGLRRHDRRFRQMSGPVGRRLRQHRRALIASAADHGISNLRVFGSVARGDDRPDSDVDIMADLPPGLGLFGLGEARAKLEAILGAEVDLVPASDIKPEIRARVEQDAVDL